MPEASFCYLESTKFVYQLLIASMVGDSMSTIRFNIVDHHLVLDLAMIIVYKIDKRSNFCASGSGLNKKKNTVARCETAYFSLPLLSAL